MPWHNKALRNIEIFDFVIFRGGSYCREIQQGSGVPGRNL